MQTFIKIAWRNITRNKKRSYITITAVGFGLGALIFILSFVEGAHQQMIENYTSVLTSHVQIHHDGFYQKKKLELNITDPQNIKNKLKSLPSLVSVSQRIKAVGLISSSESSAGVRIIGVQPSEEQHVTVIYKRVKKGKHLSENDNDTIVLGAKLARNVDVQLGDKVVLMSQALDGSIAAGAYRIKGIFDTGTDEVDQGLVFITHQAAAELFVMSDATSELAFKTASAKEVSQTVALIRSTLNRPDLEILSWQDISPSFKQWIEFDNGFMWIIVFIVMMVAAIGILNTILMGVLERTREFGILLALGTKQKEIVFIVGWESFFLATLGGFIGIILGVGLTAFFGKVGINLTLFTKALNSLYIDAVIYPQLNVPHAVISIILILTASLIVSIYPAWHAAHLKPMEAIRSI